MPGQPGRSAGANKVLKTPSPTLRLLAACDQKEGIKGNLKRITSPLHELMFFQAMACATCFTFQETLVLTVQVKTERDRVLSRATQHVQGRKTEHSHPTHILALSVAPCFFSLKHFRYSQAASDDLGPNFNVRQPLPFHLLGVGLPPNPIAPTAPVGVGSANANSFKCQLEQHSARKANR